MVDYLVDSTNPYRITYRKPGKSEVNKRVYNGADYESYIVTVEQAAQHNGIWSGYFSYLNNGQIMTTLFNGGVSFWKE